MGSFMSYANKETKYITLQDLNEILSQSKYLVALTGAGISADSGLPTFRNPNDSIWQKYNPMVYATIWGFWKSPEKIWELLCDIIKDFDPTPNDGHKALAILEHKGYLKSIITQNVDNLHQSAGSQKVIEYHGNVMEAKCVSCSKSFTLSRQLLRDYHFISHLPPKCSCGKYFKPDVVLFGERIPSLASKRALQEVKRCDVLLVIGTSASVSPASELPKIASKNGAKIIEINLEETQLTFKYSDFIFKDSSSYLIRTADALSHKTDL